MAIARLHVELMFPSPPIAACALVVGAGLAAHMLLPATDYVIWDGWWQFADVAWPEGPSVTRQHLAEVGRPLDLVYYWPFRFVDSFSSRVWLSKVFALGLWVSSACLMLGVMWRATRLPRDIATAVAATVASCPVFALLGEFSLWMYTAAVFLFWVGWFALVQLPRTNRVVATLARPALWVVFFLSFNLNSQLVAFYAVCGCLFFSRFASLRPKDAINVLKAYSYRYADFLLLPILFWFWKKLWTPSIGAYAGYNAISLSPQPLTAGIGATIQELIVPWVLNPFASHLWVLAAAVAAAVTLWMTRNSSACRHDLKLWSFRLTIAGLALLFANSFPYLAVGQVPSAYGWLSRNAILMPLPLGLLAIGACLAISSTLPTTMPHAWKALVVVWITLNTAACSRNYLTLQGFGVKQDSIAFRLREAVGRNPTAAVQLRDYFPIRAALATYAPSIWTFLPTGGSLKPRTFVFETRAALPDQYQVNAKGNTVLVIPHVMLTETMLNAMIDETTLAYAMKTIPRSGRHIVLCIRPSRYPVDGATLGSGYLWRKWVDPLRVEEFVQEATSSEMVELPEVRAGS